MPHRRRRDSLGTKTRLRSQAAEAWPDDGTSDRVPLVRPSSTSITEAADIPVRTIDVLEFEAGMCNFEAAPQRFLDVILDRLLASPSGVGQNDVAVQSRLMFLHLP